MSTKALVLAAGLGTRLKPLTNTTPKCLVDIGGKPLLEYWIDAMRVAGVTEALVNTHSHHEQVRSFLAKASATGPVRLEETYEQELLGSAGTIANNPGFVDGCDSCVIIYADNLSDVDLNAMLTFHDEHPDPVTMLLFKTPHPESCGIASMDESGRITEFVEKPTAPKSNLANAGVYVVTAEAYREIAAMDVFDLGFDVLPRFIGRMRGFEHEGYHLDIGNLDALSSARADAPRVFGSHGEDDA